MGFLGRIIRFLFRAAKIAAVAAFVAWHLATVFYRNAVEVWPEKIEEQRGQLADDCPAKKSIDWFERWSARYARATATTQGWQMFGPPLAREGDFPAVRILWPDDSTTLIRSDNEPDDLSHFFRVGDCRQRKLEDYLVRRRGDPAGEEADMFKNYVFNRYEAWRRRNPDEAREPVELRLTRRKVVYLDWNAGETEYAAIVETPIAIYNADGELQP